VQQFKETGGPLSEDRKAHNQVHGFYRSSVEHCIAYLKRYAILGGVYRGRLVTASRYLGYAVTIIANICSFAVGKRPQRGLRVQKLQK
jgi:hypothetical protein